MILASYLRFLGTAARKPYGMLEIIFHQNEIVDAVIADPAKGFLLGQRRRRCSADRVLG